MNPTNYRILVAEDDIIWDMLLSALLTGRGYGVTEASDGREAMQRVAEYEGNIHLLVTNVRMPNMDGHELALKIKAIRPEIKVLIVSADHEKNFPLEAHSHDFALLKPISPKLVLAKVAELLTERWDSVPAIAYRHLSLSSST